MGRDGASRYREEEYERDTHVHGELTFCGKSESDTRTSSPRTLVTYSNISWPSWGSMLQTNRPVVKRPLASDVERFLVHGLGPRPHAGEAAGTGPRRGMSATLPGRVADSS
jgi:hypothetical protein